MMKRDRILENTRTKTLIILILSTNNLSSETSIVVLEVIVKINLGAVYACRIFSQHKSSHN